MSKRSRKRRRQKKAERRAAERNSHVNHNSLPGFFGKQIKFSKKHFHNAIGLLLNLRLAIIANPDRELYDIINSLTYDNSVRLLIPIVWNKRWSDMSLHDFYHAVKNGNAPADVTPMNLDPWDRLVYMINETKAMSRSV